MTNSRVTIRLAQATDAGRVVTCVERAYGGYVESVGKKPAPMLANYEKLIDDGSVRVAEVGRKVIGLIVMWPEVDHLYVDNIAIDPDWQRAGVGAQLLAHAETTACSVGRTEIRLYTNKSMTANIAYYAGRGFTETHRSLDDGYQRVHFRRAVTAGVRPRLQPHGSTRSRSTGDVTGEV